VSVVSGATSPFSLPRAYLIWSAGGLLRCRLLPVCPCVVSFSKFHEPDARDILEDATSKLLPWNLSYTVNVLSHDGYMEFTQQIGLHRSVLYLQGPGRARKIQKQMVKEF